jgi:hypothetical protein
MTTKYRSSSTWVVVLALEQYLLRDAVLASLLWI